MAFNQKAVTSKYLQANDIALPNAPSDSVSSLSLNGDQQTASTMLIAGSWDNTVIFHFSLLYMNDAKYFWVQVSCYELQYDGNGKLNNAVAQAQMQHDAPVLSTDIANVCK